MSFAQTGLDFLQLLHELPDFLFWELSCVLTLFEENWKDVLTFDLVLAADNDLKMDTNFSYFGAYSGVSLDSASWRSDRMFRHTSMRASSKVRRCGL